MDASLKFCGTNLVFQMHLGSKENSEISDFVGIDTIILWKIG